MVNVAKVFEQVRKSRGPVRPDGYLEASDAILRAPARRGGGGKPVERKKRAAEKR